MNFFRLKNPLPVLLIAFMMLMAAVLVPMAAGQQSQWSQPSAGDLQTSGASLTIPGLSNIQGLSRGDNAIILSISSIAPEQGKTYFQVDSFALLKKGSEEATVYKPAGGLPGIADRGSNEMQVDLSGLQSSAGAPKTVSMRDLSKYMMTSTSSLALMAQFSTDNIGPDQSTFEVQRMGLIPPDGKMKSFDMSKPTTAILDTSSMRLYVVGFPELFDALDGAQSAMESGQYTSVAPAITEGPSVMVTPPIVVPAIVPMPIPVGPWPPGPPGPVPGHHCQPGFHWDPSVNHCVRDRCPPGQHQDASGICQPDDCPPGQHWTPSGCKTDDCPAGMHRDAKTGDCVTGECQPGYHNDGVSCKPDNCKPGEFFNGATCVSEGCPAGEHRDPASMHCVKGACHSGFHVDSSSGICVVDNCPPNEHMDASGHCVKGLNLRSAKTGQCPTGQHWDTAAKKCMPGATQTPTAKADKVIKPGNVTKTPSKVPGAAHRDRSMPGNVTAKKHPTASPMAIKKPSVAARVPQGRIKTTGSVTTKPSMPSKPPMTRTTQRTPPLTSSDQKPVKPSPTVQARMR